MTDAAEARRLASACLALGGYLTIGLIKASPYLPHGRMFAEEAAYFFPDIAHQGAAGLICLFNGRLEFWTNLLVWLATLAPLEAAAAVTTYGSLCLQAAPLLWVIATHRQLGIPAPLLVPIGLAMAGMPAAEEVWANTINLHFHAALLAALILATPLPQARAPRLCRLALLGAAGLAGITPNVLAAVAVLRALIDPQRQRVAEAALLGATALLQLALIRASADSVEARTLPEEVLPVIAILASRLLVAPVFQIDGGTALPDALFAAAPPWLIVPVVFLAVAPLGAFALATARWGDATQRVLVGTAMGLAVFCVAFSLEPKALLVATRYGDRYFYGSVVLLMVALARIRKWPGRGIAWALLVAVAVQSAVSAPDSRFNGTPWQETVREIREGEDAIVPAWPHPWTLVVHPERRVVVPFATVPPRPACEGAFGPGLP
ncbi:MAG: hypothetical protein ACFBRM_09325 [Pikeienuella sp.]